MRSGQCQKVKRAGVQACEGLDARLRASRGMPFNEQRQKGLACFCLIDGAPHSVRGPSDTVREAVQGVGGTLVRRYNETEYMNRARPAGVEDSMKPYSLRAGEDARRDNG